MVDESKWVNLYHGLELEPGFEKDTRDNENGVVFFAEYVLIKNQSDLPVVNNINEFCYIVKRLQTWNHSEQIPGLYDRGAAESANRPPGELRTISHDNITAIVAISYKYNLPYCKHVAKHAVKWQFRFDNRYPDSPSIKRFMYHPRDWFYWLYCAEGFYKLLSYIWFPVFLISSIASCLTEKNNTSGKLLTYIRLESAHEKSWLLRQVRKLCWKLLENKYGKNWLYELTKIYFKHPDHPNHKLLEEKNG